MNTVLIAFDGDHFSEGAFGLAAYLNKLQPLCLTGVFLPPVHIPVPVATEAEAHAAGVYLPLSWKDDLGQVDACIRKFEQHSRSAGIPFRIHNDLDASGMALLKQESRYAELLLLGKEMFYRNVPEQPNRYIEEILYDAECPVLLVPEEASAPAEIILSYDGSASCMYALKQFVYLFPRLCAGSRLIILYASGNTGFMPYKRLVDAFGDAWFRHTDILQLEDDDADEFEQWVASLKAPLVVTGAYGRSRTSYFFRKSFASPLVSQLPVPLFIAHP